MSKNKKIFRPNYIRNHFTRYGSKGVIFFFKTVLSNKDQIIFNHKEYKYPVYLRNNTTHIDVFYQNLFNKEYEIKISTNPEVIIDLGANSGFSTIYFPNAYPESTIIAVEPDKNNFEMLKKNTYKYANCYIYNYGIWNKSSFLKIIDNGLGNWGFSVIGTDIEDKTTIKSITLQELIKIHKIKKIDILKIDIEGAEKELFENNSAEWISITKNIMIELHDWMKPGCSKQFFDSLKDFDYSFSHKGENIIITLNH